MSIQIKTWLSFALLLAMTACQKSEVAQTPQTTPPSAIESPADSSPPTITQTPQTQSTTTTPSLEKSSKTVPNKKQVAVAQNSSSNQQCQIGAYIIDKDPNGLNVRSEPNSQSKIIDTLPTNTLAIIVDINADQGDWVQISKAQSPGRLEFQGSGWVYAQLLGTSTRGYATKSVSVYKSANNQTEVIGKIPSKRSVKLLGCERAWALVEYDGLKGWIEPGSQCANPLTTCP